MVDLREVEEEDSLTWDWDKDGTMGERFTPWTTDEGGPEGVDMVPGPVLMVDTPPTPPGPTAERTGVWLRLGREGPGTPAPWRWTLYWRRNSRVWLGRVGRERPWWPCMAKLTSSSNQAWEGKVAGGLEEGRRWGAGGPEEAGSLTVLVVLGTRDEVSEMLWLEAMILQTLEMR